MSLLSTHELSVTFGGLRALNAVDLAVAEGRLVGLIGPNGAGKTTLIDAITGFVPSTGRVVLGHRDISGVPPHGRARLGVARTWQSTELFEDLTVEQNLQVAAGRQTTGGFLLDFVRPRRPEDATEVEAALDVVGISDLAGSIPPELSQGQRKLVAVARALAAGPSIVCMDEPAAGLDATESLELGDCLRRVVRAGVAILLVDHDMSLVLEVCDYVYVLEFGLKIAEGTPAQVQRDRRVIEAYLGAGSDPGRR